LLIYDLFFLVDEALDVSAMACWGASFFGGFGTVEPESRPSAQP
jgi:hypothetical protein